MSNDLTQELFYLRVYSKVDRRMVPCQVVAERDVDGIVVHGFSMFPQTDAYIRSVAEKTFAPDPVRYDLTVLVRDYPLAFAEVVGQAAPFYKDPTIVKEDLLTEALYGCVIRTFFEKDGFVFAQHPDGYVGYVIADRIRPTTAERYKRWKNGAYAILREPVCIVDDGKGLDPSVIPPTARLILEADGSIALPSGRSLTLPPSKYKTIARTAEEFARSLEAHSSSFMDTPYLWGGKTEAGIDCSGFIQSLMIQEGIFLPRDANMQAYVGEIVGYLPDLSDLLPGDMVFFLNDSAHIFHVGVYIGDQMYLHSSGSHNIIRSSFEKSGPNYAERYGGTFAFGRRVHW